LQIENSKIEYAVCKKTKVRQKNIYCLAQKIKLFYEEFLSVGSEFTIV
jgi:hypothetical protein